MDISARQASTGAFLVGFLLLLINAACLQFFSEPTLWYFAQVAVHPVLGMALAAAAVRAIARFGARPAWALLAVGLVLGLVILVRGATTPHRLVVSLHVAASAAGAALMLASWWRAPGPLGARTTRTVRIVIVLAVATVLATAMAGRRRDAARLTAERIENPARPPLTMDQEGAGPTSPFFPSSATTNVGHTIPATFFMTAETCARCHRDIYEQWRSSVHHFSSFNNQWYRKSIEYMQDVIGTRPSKWCAGCHDHAVFFNGRFDRPITEQIDTPEAQAGLSCTSCHSITRVHSSMGQGDFEIEYPPLHDLAASDQPALRSVHDALLYLAPATHRRTFMKPFHREQTAEFCSACHKVHLDVPVNSYRWVRGFNEYDNWQASGVSGQGARSFYYPATPQSCADCHMPLVESSDPAAKHGQVRSHRFAAANTAVPFVNHDHVQLKAVEDFLRDGQISVDVFGITRADASIPSPVATTAGGALRLSSTFAVGEESGSFGATGLRSTAPAAAVLGPLDKVAVSVRRGEAVRVEVVVRTRKVGHFFPGGTVDGFDVWVEFEAVDDNGRVLLHSGAVADDGRGPVDPAAHFYRSLQLDAHGHPINKRNAWMTRSVAYVRLIPPGAADTVHYRLRIPPDAGRRVFLRARVNYRKFAWWETQWAFAGVRDASDPHPDVTRDYDDGRWTFTGETSRVSGQIKAIPDLPTTVMAQAEASLAVIDGQSPEPAITPVMDPSVRERWNDYGIGLLLQGDLKGAEDAFLKVVALDPSDADGPVNVARARLLEGDVDAGIAMLNKALALSPRLAKAHYFLGTALKTLGRYPDALEHLQIAAGQYPRDRVVLDEIGHVQFLERRFDEAVETLRQVLAVDPEDLAAHYTLMLCYQGKGDAALASRERALYERFKADEPAQAIAGSHRLRSPEDNTESQSIHEHAQTPAFVRRLAGASAGGQP